MIHSDIKFTSGDTCYVLHNRKPTETRIRAIEYKETLEITRVPKAGASNEYVTRETVVSKTAYSTFLNPNQPLTENDIAPTMEELQEKLFGAGGKSSVRSSPADDSK